ncbi:MAG: TRAP transporter fused permease subunit [Dehalococcoidales bacterium]|nr:TRAP transporter fused permease subunit [Dehalococcoidales bacterium]
MSGIIDNIFQPVAKRNLNPGFFRRFIFVFAVSSALYHLIALGIWHAPVDLHSIIHLFSMLALTFLGFSYSKTESNRLPFIDITLAVVCLALGTYFIINLDTFINRAIVITPLSGIEITASVLLLLLLLEATRRVVGLPFVIIIFGFLLLVLLGPYLPGIWKNPGLNLTKILDAIVWTRLQGIWDIPLRVSATYVVLFFIFGKLMQYAGLGDLLISLCNSIAGGTRGGPAKAAVIGSAFVGSITAGPVTNVAMTGTFTIPMMKQIGYKPSYAGAIEAAASTGASVVPPIMTGIVFIMAELTGTPIARIMILAIIPAFFYYLCLLLQVHYQAVKLGINATGQKASVSDILNIFKKRGHLLIPLLGLVILLFMGYQPVIAVIWAILSVPIVAALRKDTRMAPQRIMQALSDSLQDLAIVTPTCALCGIIIVALFQTGLGSIFSHIVITSVGNSMLLLVVLGGLACLLLGTSIPPTPAYLMTTLIVAPLMVNAKVPLLVAHFFSLYYANIAFITPPIAIGALVAASIAKANFWSVSFTALRLAIVAFIIPIVFVYRPPLLLFGNHLEIIWAISALVIMVFCLSSALEGWMFNRLNAINRLLLLACGIALLPPNLLVNAIAIVIASLIMLQQLRKRNKVSSVNNLG